MLYRDNPEYLNVTAYIPEFLHDYPKSNAHGDVDACGIWARHVEGLHLENVDITPRSRNMSGIEYFMMCRCIDGKAAPRATSPSSRKYIFSL